MENISEILPSSLSSISLSGDAGTSQSNFMAVEREASWSRGKIPVRSGMQKVFPKGDIDNKERRFKLR